MRSEITSTQQQGPEVEQLREQIRENVRQQLEAQRAQLEAQRDARQAARDAQQAMRDAARAGQELPGVPTPPAIPGVPGAPGAPKITVNKDGKTIYVDENGRVTVVDPDAPQGMAGVPMPFEPTIPPEAVTMSIAFFIMIAVIIIGLPLARAFARRMDRKTAQPVIPPELTEQLHRLEQSVDTIAVEVERISEGQRFSSGLLREMHPLLQRTQGAAAALVDRANGGTR